MLASSGTPSATELLKLPTGVNSMSSCIAMYAQSTSRTRRSTHTSISVATLPCKFVMPPGPQRLSTSVNAASAGYMCGFLSSTVPAMRSTVAHVWPAERSRSRHTLRRRRLLLCALREVRGSGVSVRGKSANPEDGDRVREVKPSRAGERPVRRRAAVALEATAATRGCTSQLLSAAAWVVASSVFQDA